MVRAIITDLDKTLLRTDKTVSDDSVRVLAECRNRGLRVMAATARPDRVITEYRRRITFDAVTTLNGAVVLLPGGTESTDIPKPAALALVRRLSRIGDVFISLETDNGIFANTEYPLWMPKVYPDLADAPLPEHIYKVLVMSAGTDLAALLPGILPENTYFTVADGSLYQIMNSGATKWNGILHMLDAFGISADDAVYFGDDNDDIGPVRLCGTGVAVANAIGSVLSAADAVTLSNDEDGVAKYIEDHILR